ncbi:metal ABC transporter substrate-binding protein [Streptomyces sp. JJ38]|uniref:metal ABC transporter substrate-binding protein n=1 Tax=Streptomyces sp. JJ38 TaxID=2738128 RepID=UPI001C5800B0|nr:metal ABC transporter substrate-binding protein [Streptomyces sp. JJ38]MBW1598335.1 zinc ABC transporter substrate-binding protein [Streptomyces sp. JJ38]
MNARRRPHISAPAIAGACTLALFALTGCGTGSAGTDEDGKLKVVTSFYPMEFLAEEIGGEHVAVSTLTKPGTDPHDLRISPQQTAELTESGLVLYVKGLQPAVDDAVEQSGVEHVVEAGALAEHAGHEEHGAEPHGARSDHGADEGHEGHEGHDEHGAHEDEGHEHGAEDGTHEDDGHQDEGHEDHDGHDHGGLDPHVWLDPVQYAAVAEGVGEALAEADPDHAEDYRKNADALVGKLGELDTEFENGLKNTATDTFITSHAAFGHLAARYGLDQEAIAGLSPEDEPSGARMKELHDVAERENVSTVFFETLASDRTAKALAGDLDLKTDVLDPLEGVTEQSRGDDYFAVMRANLEALQKALGAEQAA